MYTRFCVTYHAEQRLVRAMPGWLKKILAEPTASVPDAGRALGIRGRNQSYEAVRRGEIQALRFGRTLRVPTAWLRKQLQLKDAA